jgi:diguanylate cyclase (GGDEF)-like protein
MFLTSRPSLFDRLAKIAIAIVATMTTAVIFGWLLHMDVLKSLLPGSATMKANTAFGLLACSIVLTTLRNGPGGSKAAHLARAGSLVIVALGALSLAEDIFSIDLGIDQALIRDAGGIASVHPGRMSPATAASFISMGLALLAFKARRRSMASLAHWVVLLPLFIATLTLTGYVYGVPALYQQRTFASMAVHTASCFFLLALALLAADTRHGATRIAVTASAGGMVYRRLLPTIVLILLAVGWLTLIGLRQGLYQIEFGLAVMVLVSVAVCALAIASIANQLHKIDVVRKTAEDEIMSLNIALERRVLERTRELSDLSDSLSIANKSLEKLSLHDGLTGLANRRFFDVHLGSQVTITRRRHRTLGLIMCDVDYFKSFNDFYGHQAGDECLRQIADALRSCCSRSTDMAARYGGEEFALILPDTDLDGAVQIAEKALRMVAELKIPHAGSSAAAHVTISCGVAILTRESGLTADQLITAADLNLFQAKYMGRNRTISVPGHDVPISPAKTAAPQPQ